MEGIMFAHQVIDFHNNTVIRDINNDIRESTKFNITNSDDILNLFNRSKFTDIKKYLQLPYEKIWVDGHISINGNLVKAGMLAHSVIDLPEIKCEAHISIYLYAYINNQWFPMFGKINKTGIDEEQAIYLRPPFIRECGYDVIIEQIYFKAMNIFKCFILLLNCKNIRTEIHKPSEALNKSRRKKGKQELFSYKTLKLLLPGNKEKHLLADEPTGEHNRIHFCRGHFKEYTADAPLFGRITGLWWWQPHVRGQNKDGIVMKDYEIEAKGE